LILDKGCRDLGNSCHSHATGSAEDSSPKPDTQRTPRSAGIATAIGPFGEWLASVSLVEVVVVPEARQMGILAPEFLLKTFLIAARVLALLTLLFVPAIAVLVLVGFVTGQSSWFALIGLPALLANAAIVFAKPQRDRVWRSITAIAGTNPRI
jgi:hypothetical protein